MQDALRLCGNMHADERFRKLQLMGAKVVQLATFDLLQKHVALGTPVDALTANHTVLTRDDSIVEMGKTLGIDVVLRMHASPVRSSAIRASTEAVIAAAFFDGGYPAVRDVIEHALGDVEGRLRSLKSKPPSPATLPNPIGVLQEWFVVVSNLC